jgi:hypothetical protein
MRTTVTIDRDAEQLLRDAMQRSRKGFKATLNQAIRKGLGGAAGGAAAAPFTVKARALGLRAGIDSARLNQVNDEFEVDAFLETTRRLQREVDRTP